jgi:preprotein translocase subunit SecY
MFNSISRVFQIPELRAKILFTFLLLVICRLCNFIPVPGINSEIAFNMMRSATGGTQNLFQLVDSYTGGAFSQMTVVALGVVPYISASIMMQLFVAVIPSLQREIKENQDAGRRKVNKLTRLLTVGLSLLQSFVFARYAMRMDLAAPGLVANELLDVQLFGVPWLFFLVVMATMTTGTMFLMWIGEQITDRGIGNGMSLIITLGILSQFPTALGLIIQQLNLDSQLPGQLNFAYLVVIAIVFVIVTLGTILIIQGHRRIPLQYARRVVGRREVQGGSSYIPLKINYAGVIPVIFASALLMFPATIGGLIGQDNILGVMASWLNPGSNSFLYLGLYVGLIILLTYFWTATQFHPEQIASEMKKNGAFIPGIRQGRPTQEYIEATMNRITLLGALFLATIAVLPNLIGRFLGLSPTISYFFGGTALLILVGVVLDTMKQIESHLLMKRYDGFMKKGRVRGR